MRWMLLGLLALAVAGCAKNDVKLPDSVASNPPASRDLYASEHPGPYWDEVISSGLPITNLPSTARLLVQNARKLRGEDRQAEIDENIARFREGIPLIAKAKGGDTAAQEIRILLAQSALDAEDITLARETAEEALAGNVDPKDDAYGDVAHEMNLVLASCALAMGNKPEARRRVLQASRTPGSSQLDSFGPKFPIVYELYKVGDRDLMIEYLTNIGRFWKSDLLADWKRSIASGKEPEDGLWALATTR